MRMSRKATSGCCCGDRLQRAAAVLAGGDDLQLRPGLGQQLHQRVAQQGFVFGDDALSHGWLTLPLECGHA